MLTMELERFIAVLGLAYELPYVPDDSARREQDLLHITMVDNAFSFVTGMMLKSGESLDISYHSVTYIWQQNLRVPKRVVLQNLPPRVWTSIKSLRLQVLLFLARLLSLLQPRVRHLFVLQKQVWFCKWYLFLKNLPFFLQSLSMMGGGVSSKSQMNSEKFLMFSLVMLEMFLNTVLCSWHTRYPLIQHLLVLVRIRSQPTLTSTSGLFCTSHLLTLPLHLIMKVKMKQRSSQVRLWVFFFFSLLCFIHFSNRMTVSKVQACHAFFS